jgi:hypothetical protein
MKHRLGITIVLLSVLISSTGCCYKVSQQFINGGDQQPLMMEKEQISHLGPQDTVAFTTGNLARTLVPNEVLVQYLVPCEDEPKKPKKPKEPKGPKEPKEPKEPKKAKAPKEPKEPKKAKAPKEPKEPKEPKAPKGKNPYLTASKWVKFEGKWQILAEVKKSLPSDEIPLLLVVYNSGSGRFEGDIEYFDHLPEGASLGDFVGMVDVRPNLLRLIPYIGLLLDPTSFSTSKSEGHMSVISGSDSGRFNIKSVALNSDRGIGFQFMMKLPPFPQKK